jgi:dihydroorotate dehydrogenase (fumarate)
MGFRLTSPIIAGSSPLTATPQTVERCIEAGAGAVVLRSLFEEQILADLEKLSEQSDMYFWYPEAVDYVNASVKTHGVEEYLDLVRDAKARMGDAPLFASVNCLSAREWPAFAEKIAGAGADALELNISLSPADMRRNGHEAENIYLTIAETVRARISIPLSVKVGQSFSSPGKMLKDLSETGIDGLVLFNRYYQPDIDTGSMEFVAAPKYSTPVEGLAPLRWIGLLAGDVSCDLAAATGIHDAQGAIKQLLAGASAVQVCSALLLNGADYCGELNDGIEQWMREHGLASIDSFRGKLSKRATGSSAAYERLQYVQKAFSDIGTI